MILSGEPVASEIPMLGNVWSNQTMPEKDLVHVVQFDCTDIVPFTLLSCFHVACHLAR
jgi:hypothetical protein